MTIPQPISTAHPLMTGAAPDWASAWGQDSYGVWVEFTFKNVAQRMRWIPPGRFRMGSPEDEAGRDDEEVPHETTLTSGFWLFDTPCTQALWEAVQGSNPSSFTDADRSKTEDRPVETVTWDDCQDFISKLNRQVPGLRLVLPSEAQWEYACRAGTGGATYAGELTIRGECDALELHAISWYGGNSGVDFDLEKGFDSSDWSGKQFAHVKAGTRRVKGKKPNPWGLYDMLGNVWEWCADWHGPFDGGAQVDPSGPKGGADRVIRGGSWNSGARDVRAAYRLRGGPGLRSDYLGFRCARVQEPGRGPLE